MTILFSVVSAAFLLLAFPKFDLFFIAYFALVPLFIAIRMSKTPREAAISGMAFGSVYMGGYLFWVNVLSRWAGLWANAGWAGLLLFQALFFSFFAFLYKLSADRWPRRMIWVSPLIWAALEWARAAGPYGVTGGDLCYSQTPFLPVIQIAGFATCYGISFAVVMFNEGLTELIKEKKLAPLLLSALLLILIIAYGYGRIIMYSESGRPVRVSVIQANVAQDVKLDFGLAYEIVGIHDSLSRKAVSGKPDIIVWPETSITTYLLQTKQILGSVKELIKAGNSYYLIGTPHRDGDKIYNSIVAFSNRGEVVGRYDKQRLVPFGEYLPLRPVFYKLLQENPLFAEDYNSVSPPSLIEAGGVKVGAVICFESTFPYLVRDKVRRGAQFILVATNDAWFFDSAAVYQHVQAAQMRAVENNIYVVQAANTGISMIVDPLGRKVMSTKACESAILTGNVYVH